MALELAVLVVSFVISLLLLYVWGNALKTAIKKKKMAWFWVMLLFPITLFLFWLVEGIKFKR